MKAKTVTIANLQLRKYVPTKSKRGNGGNPVCFFCLSPAEHVASGIKYIGSGDGIPFNDVLCTLHMEVMKAGTWPLNSKMEEHQQLESEKSDTETNNSSIEEEQMKAKKNITKPTTVHATPVGGMQKTQTKSDLKKAPKEKTGKTFSEVIIEKMGKGFSAPASIIEKMVKAYPGKPEKTVTNNTRWWLNKLKNDKTVVRNEEGEYKVR